MRKLCFVSLLVILLASCSRQAYHANVGGVIHPAVKVDSLYIGLYSMVPDGLDEYVGDPLQFIGQTDTAFSLDVKPGKYTLAVYAYGVEKYVENFVILEKTDKLHFDISLPQYGYDASADSIFVIGDYNGWDHTDKVPLEKKGDKYLLTQDVIKKGENYKFFNAKNGAFFDFHQPDIVVVKNYATFNNISDGSPIVFDPALYLQPREKATAQVEGLERSKEYRQIQEKTDYLTRKIIFPFLTKRSPKEKEEYEATYSKISSILDSLEIEHPDFAQMIINERFGYVRYTHPVNYAQIQLYQAHADSAAYTAFYTSDDYMDFVNGYIKLAKQLDPEFVFIKPEIARAILSFDVMLKQHPPLAEKLGVEKDYFETWLNNFIPKIPSEESRGNFLFEFGRTYADNDMVESAKKYFMLVKEKYPNSWYVTEGGVERELNSLKIRIGLEAPGFHVVSLDGDSLDLNDFKGKFVFIDFWGSWCGPCRGEIPNLRKMANTIPSDQLQMIGLARDDEKALRKYLKEEPLPYPNAIAPDEVLTNWGISGFPTTFLIDPQGRVLAKNLRGENVIELVKKEMEKYRQKKGEV